MKPNQSGFGLVEVMVALVLGLLVVLGITQIFVSSKQTYEAQDASARLQEDARYALSRITQELRMAGMFGCLSLNSGSVADVPAAFADPIQWNGSTLSIITASATSGSSSSAEADWTLTTDCRTAGTVKPGAANPAAGEMAFPIRQVEYQYDDNAQTLSVRNSGSGSFQPLISGVTSFAVSFGLAASSDSAYASGSYATSVADPSLIRSVRIRMTLADPNGKAAAQSYSAVAALRNRLP
ncbi:prepilin-type N-terminal cleavage/methylation domain-containing protein [Pseudomonas sp. CAU 1711]|uniref:PilW family protein n=1 Tax=Pseudomonas sp. CAU 1711 TaxID=3140356 RepID=UPI003260BF9B